MKKAYLIHGWGGSSESEGWFSWLKEEMKNRDIKVIAFDMPNTNEPRINEWVGFLEKNVKEKGIDEQTYFIGHSVGCQTILRFLEKLNAEIKIAGCIFVAPWFNLKETAYEAEEEKDIAKPWIETPINFEKVKQHTKNFLCIFSDNDPCVPLSDSKIFKEKLGAEIIIKNNEEHFNTTEKINEIIEFIEK